MKKNSTIEPCIADTGGGCLGARENIFEAAAAALDMVDWKGLE